jgi:hypothetical protein
MLGAGRARPSSCLPVLPAPPILPVLPAPPILSVLPAPPILPVFRLEQWQARLDNGPGHASFT